MIVYLDQNKWIELARMFHRRDGSERATQVLTSFESAVNSGGVILPLSSIHYMEMSRVSNAARRSRLGSAMWHFSRGRTMVGYPAIIRHELELALLRHFPQIMPSNFEIIGKGHSHAFGTPPLQGSLQLLEERIERSMLTGDEQLGIKPISFRGTTQRENFQRHLATLRRRYTKVPPDLRENWLYAVSMVDILTALNDVIAKHGIEKGTVEFLGAKGLKQIIDDMPTRRVDLHLHRQVLRNSAYVAHPSDLEDWSGIVSASCYCDVVICERHMADMLRRDRFVTKARIEVDLAAAFRAG